MGPSTGERMEQRDRVPAPRGAVLGLLCLASAACAAGAGGGTDQPAEDERPPMQSAQAAAPSAPLPPLDRAWVIFGPDTVVAEVARTPEERAQGLMYRDAVPDGTGMLFVFEDSRMHSFWMANTYVALDIAYMDPAYRIVDIIAMEPLVTDPYPADAPAMYALEVRQGWYAEHGITEGDTAQIVYGPQRGG